MKRLRSELMARIVVVILAAMGSVAARADKGLT